MTELGTILDLINKYGLPLVLLVILMIWIKPKVDDVWNLLIGKVSKSDDKDDECLREIIECENNVNMILHELVLKYKIARAVVWQFHNGVRSITGIPFMRLSITHEYTTIVPVIQLYQNIPMSFVSNTVQELLDNDYVVVHEGDIQYGASATELKNAQLKTVLYVAIRDPRNCLFGALSLSFAEDMEFTEDELDEFNHYSYRISAILETMADKIAISDRRCRHALRS